MLPNYSKTASCSIKSLLQSKVPIEAIGCHSPLSAKLAEEAGFPVLWISSLELSSVNALPDANFLSMAENLDAIRKISLAVQTPILVDCDSGYGNEVNVYRMVQLYEQAGASAVCIEDNIFPKKCSFYEADAKELVPAEEHARKITAACSARKSTDFVVVARTEAFIRKLGLDEAMRRADMYADAGADAIFVHSKKDTNEEIAAFSEAWDKDIPLVCSPTTYFQYTSQELFELGYSLMIYANQGLRSSVRAMEETFSAIRRTKSTREIEANIAPLTEVFKHTGVYEMQDLISSLHENDIR